mmetsp:Transcript_7446/g.11284  ORF Transcript_7446/g.11284 Transcript_7446/m.11284 type:complete len:85 (-) Transcript_7446:566-820(-)
METLGDFQEKAESLRVSRQNFLRKSCIYCIYLYLLPFFQPLKHTFFRLKFYFMFFEEKSMKSLSVVSISDFKAFWKWLQRGVTS